MARSVKVKIELELESEDNLSTAEMLECFAQYLRHAKQRGYSFENGPHVVHIGLSPISVLTRDGRRA